MFLNVKMKLKFIPVDLTMFTTYIFKFHIKFIFYGVRICATVIKFDYNVLVSDIYANASTKTMKPLAGCARS